MEGLRSSFSTHFMLSEMPCQVPLNVMIHEMSGFRGTWQTAGWLKGLNFFGTGNGSENEEGGCWERLNIQSFHYNMLADLDDLWKPGEIQREILLLLTLSLLLHSTLTSTSSYEKHGHKEQLSLNPQNTILSNYSVSIAFNESLNSFGPQCIRNQRGWMRDRERERGKKFSWEGRMHANEKNFGWGLMVHGESGTGGLRDGWMEGGPKGLSETTEGTVRSR